MQLGHGLLSLRRFLPNCHMDDAKLVCFHALLG
jgi:hypothetical protein